MKIKCLCRMKLPFSIGFSNEIEEPICIDIEDISISFIKKENDRFYDMLELTTYCEIEEELIIDDPRDTHKLLPFTRQMIYSFGRAANRFINSYYRTIDCRYISQLSNGDDLTVPYSMIFADEDDKPIIPAIFNGNGDVRVINGKNLEEIKHDVNVVSHDIVEECTRLSKTFLENGYFDMAVINISMASEAFIKRYVFSREIRIKDLEDVKTGYIDKFYCRGLELLKGISLLRKDEEWYRVLREIDDIRNRIAHGGSLHEIKRFKDMEEQEIHDLIDDYIWEVEDIFEWIDSL